MPVAIDDDVERAADRIPPSSGCPWAEWAPAGANFHYDVFVRMGYQRVADRVQELFLRKAEAAVVPTELVEQVALVGPVAKIRRDVEAWDPTVVDEIAVQGLPDDVGVVARALL